MRSGTRRRLTLRQRLVAVVVALVAVVAAVMGIASTLALRGSLVDQVDERLTQSAERAVRAPFLRDGSGPQGARLDEQAQTVVPGTADDGTSDDASGSDSTGDGASDDTTPPTLPDGGAPPPASLQLGQGAGTVNLRLEAGSTTPMAAYVDDDGTLSSLSDEAVAALLALPDDGRPRSVDLGDLGDYRADSVVASDGATVVTALPLTTVTSTVTSYVAAEAGVALLALVVAGAGGLVLVRRELRPLERVAATATRVARQPLDRGEVVLERVPAADTDPSTEVGQVGAALDQLLGHVEAALAARHESESQVRQFVADASHELRTPLASIRGYAELVRRSPEAVPSGALASMARVESESERMTALVEDLLLLARLDAGRPLAQEPVDLALLAVDALSDAHAAAPDHGWQLDLPDDPDDLVVVGDDHRLRQVLANLLSNARLHTPAGTAVSVRVRSRDGSVVVEVADEGPGIPPELRDSLFQRFTRGDASRTRVTGTTGLGLAIVDAVVTAHGGTIDVASSARGTTFVVTLPGAPEGIEPLARPDEVTSGTRGRS